MIMYHAWAMKCILPCNYGESCAFIKLCYICDVMMFCRKDTGKTKNKIRDKTKIQCRPQTSPYRPLAGCRVNIRRHTQLKEIRDCCSLIFKETKIYHNILDEVVFSTGENVFTEGCTKKTLWDTIPMEFIFSQSHISCPTVKKQRNSYTVS